MMLISKTRFIFISSVFLTLVTAFMSLHGLRQEQQELQNIIQSISGYSSEYNDLKEQLFEINSYIRELEEENLQIKTHNQQLEDILFARKNNYLVAVNLRGADIPVLSKSGFNVEMFDRAWKELGTEKMMSASESFIQAEKELGVNALVIASIAAHESDFGRSNLALQKNNLFGFGAFSPNPYEAAIEFESSKQGTIYVSQYIRKHYLNREGRHYRGETLRSININYAADTGWADKVARIMSLIASASITDEEFSEWEKLLDRN